MKHRNEALDLLTENHEPVAQMTIALAHKQGYTSHPDYAVVNPVGDETSAGLPYFVDVHEDNNRFAFLSYDGTRPIEVKPQFQVLVYRRQEIKVSDGDQIDMLEIFIAQFAEDSLIRRFLTLDLLDWLRRNKDMPDIHHELVRMKNAAHRLENNLADYQRLYDENIPY